MRLFNTGIGLFFWGTSWVCVFVFFVSGGGTLCEVISLLLMCFDALLCFVSFAVFAPSPLGCCVHGDVVVGLTI